MLVFFITLLVVWLVCGLIAATLERRYWKKRDYPSPVGFFWSTVCGVSALLGWTFFRLSREYWL